MTKLEIAATAIALIGCMQHQLDLHAARLEQNAATVPVAVQAISAAKCPLHELAARMAAAPCQKQTASAVKARLRSMMWQ
jgi:hypothetical protein